MTSIRRVRRAEVRPASVTNDHGSVDVRVGGEATRATFERGLTRPIPLVDVVALGALAGGVAGINEDHRNTSESGLVLNKRAELVERPRGQLHPMTVPAKPMTQRDADRVAIAFIIGLLLGSTCSNREVRVTVQQQAPAKPVSELLQHWDRSMGYAK